MKENKTNITLGRRQPNLFRKRIQSTFFNGRRSGNFFKPAVQPKLAVGPENDVYEQEADAMAEQVMRMPDTSLENTSNISPIPVTHVSRKCAACEHEEKEELQRKEDQSADGDYNMSSVENVLNSSGHSLDAGTKDFMESRFGHDFGNVQIHNDSQAHQSSADINALAYTYQNHVVFGEGQYQPSTNQGRQLIAHELTHTIQQGSNVQQKTIQRKKEKDEEKNAEVPDFDAAIKANQQEWMEKFKFYNALVSVSYGSVTGIDPFSYPIAYTNHIFEIEKAFKTYYGSQWDDTKNKPDGILDDYDITVLQDWADKYEQGGKKPEDLHGIDAAIIDRMLKIKANKARTPQYTLFSNLGNFDQLRMVNENRTFVVEKYDHGDFVWKIQEVLVDFGYTTGDDILSHTFLDKTEEAVKNFQRDAGITDDGRIGFETLHLMDLRLSGKGSVYALPGSQSYVFGPLAEGLVLYVDGNGDQRKELKITFKKKGAKPIAEFYNLDTKETKEFPLELHSNISKPLWFKVVQQAEGLTPLAIQIVEGRKKDAKGPEPDPETMTIDGVTTEDKGQYDVKLNSVKQTLVFDASLAKTPDDIASYTPGTSALEQSIDVTLGAYKDNFKIVLLESAFSETGVTDRPYRAQLKIFAISKSENKIATVYGDPVGIALKKPFNELKLNVTDSQTFLGLDLDGDDDIDVIISDLIEQRLTNKQDIGRKNTVVFSGDGVIGKRQTRSFSKVMEKYLYIVKKDEDSFKDFITAHGGEALTEQPTPNAPSEDIKVLDLLLSKQYFEAAKDNIVRADTFLAWQALKSGMILIDKFKGNSEYTAEDKQTIEATAIIADNFYQKFKEETKGKEVTEIPGDYDAPSGVTNVSNPYTNEMSQYTLLGRSYHYEIDLPKEIRDHNWEMAFRDFKTFSRGYNDWVADQYKINKAPENTTSKQVKDMMAYKTKLEEISSNPKHKYFTKIKAVYYSFEQFSKTEDGVPKIDLPIYYYLDEDETFDNKWRIIDMINAQDPFQDYISYKADPNPHPDKDPEPPKELFDKLNAKSHLPKGFLLYTTPSGISRKLEMTEPWSVGDYFAAGAAIFGLIAMGALAIGTGGAAVPVEVEVVFAISAVLGATAATLDLIHNARNETLTPTKAMIDLGQIAASFIGIGALRAGKIIVEAGEAAGVAGFWAKYATLADKYYVPLVYAGAATDAFNLLVMTADTFEQMKKIDDSTASDDEKSRQRLILIAQLMVAGAFTVVALKGGLPSLDRERTILLTHNADGIPIAYDAATWFTQGEKVKALMATSKEAEALLGDVKNSPVLYRLLENQELRSFMLEKPQTAIDFLKNQDAIWLLEQQEVRAYILKDAALPAAERKIGTLLSDPATLSKLLGYSEFRSVISKNPEIAISFIKHPEALPVLDEVMDEYKTLGAAKVIAKYQPKGSIKVTETPLTAEQKKVSADASSKFNRFTKTNEKIKPRQAVEAGDDVQSEEYLAKQFKNAEAATEELKTFIQGFVEKTKKGTMMMRPGLKGMARTKEKIAVEYSGDASQLVDIAGGKIVYNNLDDLYSALGELTKTDGIKIVNFKDRFVSPQEGGYRDILMNVETGNGHIAEFRMHLSQFDEASDKFEHALYEMKRSIAPEAALKAGTLTDEQMAIQLLITKRTNELYNKVIEDLPK